MIFSYKSLTQLSPIITNETIYVKDILKGSFRLVLRFCFDDPNEELGMGAKNGKLESWNAGELERWRAGTLESWNAGELERWRAGTLESWNAVELERWGAGKVTLGQRENKMILLSK
eukprot:gene11883-2433_t